MAKEETGSGPDIGGPASDPLIVAVVDFECAARKVWEPVAECIVKWLTARWIVQQLHR